MENIGDQGEIPVFTIGFRRKTFVISVVLLLVSLIAMYFLGDEFTAIHGVNTSGTIYLGLNLAGLISGLVIIFAFLSVVSGLMSISVGIGFFTTGQIRLFDNHAAWKRRWKITYLDYNDFKDVYIGYHTNGPSGGITKPFRIISFYIGNKRLTFNLRKHSDLDSFLRTRIPKGNIDVDDGE